MRVPRSHVSDPPGSDVLIIARLSMADARERSFNLRVRFTTG